MNKICPIFVPLEEVEQKVNLHEWAPRDLSSFFKKIVNSVDIYLPGPISL